MKRLVWLSLLLLGAANTCVASDEHWMPRTGSAWLPDAQTLAVLKATAAGYAQQDTDARENAIRKVAKVPAPAQTPSIGKKSKFADYYFVYEGHTDANGRKIVLVDGYCSREFQITMATQDAIISDGGDCIIHLPYDLLEKRFLGFSANGLG